MDKENVLGEKIKLCIAIFLMSLLCLNGCSSNSVEYSSETIDTVGVVIFTDKLIEDKEYDILQRSVSQRTDTNDKFIVEYWWRKNNDSGHYGYYIEQIDGDNYIVIEEGEDIKETSDTLRGPKVNARKHWDGESWILEDAKTRKPLLIGTRSQILDEYDRRNKSL